MGWFDDLIGIAGAGEAGASLLTLGGYKGMLDDLKKYGQTAYSGAQDIGSQAYGSSQFVPFTVTGATGAGVTTNAAGGSQFNLSPQEEALQNMMFGGASQFLEQSQAPIAQTEQDIFNRMYAVAAPERERQQLGLEERLAAQGRLGTSSAAYGGATPEQLALAQAQEEQMNQMSLQARQQALAEQQQYASLGQGMLSGAYAPQSALLNVFEQGRGLAGLVDVGRRQGAQLQAEAGMSGIDAQLQSMLGRGNLTAEGIAALARLLSS